MTRYFHRTTASAAGAILAHGFRDGRGRYLTDEEHCGVWISDVPLDANEGAEGDTLLTVEAPAAEIEPFEWVEEEKLYREFLVPAALLNRVGKVALVVSEENAEE